MKVINSKINKVIRQRFHQCSFFKVSGSTECGIGIISSLSSNALTTSLGVALQGFKNFQKYFSWFAINSCLVLALVGLSLPNTTLAQGGVRVIQTCNLPDIGRVSVDHLGPYIIWNPCYANQVGPFVAAFFWQHEHGHIYWRTPSEDAADCYAVIALRHTNPQAIQAFIQYKRSQGWGGGSMAHRPGVARAQHVEDCFLGRHRH